MDIVARAEAWLQDARPYSRPPQELLASAVAALKSARAENARLNAEPNLSGYLASEGAANYWPGGAFDA